jgi:hypothetical protein
MQDHRFGLQQFEQAPGWNHVVGHHLKQSSVVHRMLWFFQASRKSSASTGLALGFKVKHFARNTLAVDNVGAVGNRLFQLGYASAVDDWQIAQLFSDGLQLLSLTAQVNGLSGAFYVCRGFDGCWCIGLAGFLGRTGARRATDGLRITQAIEV